MAVSDGPIMDIMKLFSIDKISEFRCTGGRCPDTCCAGWDNIPIDEPAFRFYQTVEGSIGEELRKEISHTEGEDARFIMNEQGRCPFLNDDNLCRLVLTLGEDKLCFTCDTYPRKKEIYGDVMFAWLSISCPEAAKKLLSRKEKLTSYLTDYDEPGSTVSDYDRELFDIFIASFADCIDILQNRSLSIGERISICLLFIYQLDTNLKLGTDTSGLLALFSDPANAESLALKLDPTVDITSKIKLFNFIYQAIGKSGFKRYDNLYGLFDKFLPYCSRNDMSDVLDELYRYYACFKEETLQIELEQLLVYCFTHYYFKDFSRRCFMRNITFIVVLVQLYICFVVFSSLEAGHLTDFEDRVLFISRLSRLFEHNQTIMDDIYTRMEMLDMSSLSYLLRLASL